MSRVDFIALAAVAVVAIMLAAAWKYAGDSAGARHCSQMLDGLAVIEGTTGSVVCLRRDVVLRKYT